MANSLCKGHLFCCFKSFSTFPIRGQRAISSGVPERCERPMTITGICLVNIQWPASIPKCGWQCHAINSSNPTLSDRGSHRLFHYHKGMKHGGHREAKTSPKDTHLGNGTRGVRMQPGSGARGGGCFLSSGVSTSTQPHLNRQRGKAWKEGAGSAIPTAEPEVTNSGTGSTPTEPGSTSQDITTAGRSGPLGPSLVEEGFWGWVPAMKAGMGPT